MIYPQGGEITALDIAEGHREKTLTLLWRLIFHCELTSVLDAESLQHEIAVLEKKLPATHEELVLALLSFFFLLLHFFTISPLRLLRTLTFNLSRFPCFCAGAARFAIYKRANQQLLEDWRSTTSPRASRTAVPFATLSHSTCPTCCQSLRSGTTPRSTK